MYSSLTAVCRAMLEVEMRMGWKGMFSRFNAREKETPATR